MLWPGLGCGGIAAVLVRDDLQLEDPVVFFLLGMPAFHWFAVGLLQGIQLGALLHNFLTGIALNRLLSRRIR